MLLGPTPRIRCIDVGGTTLRGRAIKEFTEFYDRGYWGLGTRKADPAYDLFAVAMIMINTAYPKRFNKTIGGISQLREAIRKQKDLLPFEKVIVKALQGHYTNALQMRTELMSLIIDKKNHDTLNKSAVTNTNSTMQKQKINQSGMQQPKSRQTYRRKRKKNRWMETIIITIFLALLYFLYIFQKLL